MFNAFKQITFLDFITITKESVSKELIQTIRDDRYIPFRKFEKLNYYNVHSLNFLFDSLNSLSNINKIDKYEAWLGEISGTAFLKKVNRLSDYFIDKEKQTIEQPETVFYYAFLLFINDENSDDGTNEINFKRWMRVCRNLIFNTYIQSPKEFIKAIKAIKAFSKHKNNVYEYLEKEDAIGFLARQQKQELQKIRLFAQSETWKSKILEIENHVYFQGDIEFILNFCKDENEFEYYSKRISLLYSNQIRNSTNKILERALLTQGDYLPKAKSNHTFCLPTAGSLRARRDNWQRFFESDKSIYLFKLVDKLVEPKLEVIEENLVSLINEYNEGDWKELVIKSPETIEFCTKGFIRFENEEGDENERKYNIKLLRKERVYGKHAELHSYNFYKTVIEKTEIKPFNKKTYYENRMNQYQHPCIRLFDFEYKDYHLKLEISYSNGMYKIEFMDELKTPIEQTDIINIFKLNMWIINVEVSSFFKEYKDQQSLEKELLTILDSLDNLNE